MNLVAPLGFAELLRVFEQVAGALAHMHGRGVCHGDLKPGNLILGPGQRVKVIDYGLAWVEGEPINRLRGTAEYMAPETAERKVISRRTDIFNLGAVMYRLVTHRFPPVPTPGLSLGENAYRRSLVPVAALRPAAPAKLCELIHGCLDYQPDRRPQSAAEVGALLRQMPDTGGGDGQP
jgi:serine/threonine protein kinase